jgi:hypothetical protein
MVTLIRRSGFVREDGCDEYSTFFGSTVIVSLETLLGILYSTTHSLADFKDCDFTDFQDCLFVEGNFVSQQNLAQTITNFLGIKGENSLDPLYLWNIVIIGHLIKQDLKVLLRLGVDFYKIAPTLAILRHPWNVPGASWTRVPLRERRCSKKGFYSMEYSRRVQVPI